MKKFFANIFLSLAKWCGYSDAVAGIQTQTQPIKYGNTTIRTVELKAPSETTNPEE